MVRRAEVQVKGAIEPMKHTLWTDSEEASFERICAASRLTRIQAIQLWKRCRKDTQKALRIAAETYPPLTDKQLAHVERMRQARNRVTLCAHLPAETR
jgi:hypothetical protein